MFFAQGYTYTNEYKLTDGGQPCKELTNDYILYNGYSGGVALLLPGLNSISILIMTKITIFERNKTLTEDMSSIMGKIFFTSFVNTVNNILTIFIIRV